MLFNLSTSKLFSVQVIMSPPDWFLSRAFLSLDFARLILKEKSSSFNFGDKVFHILVEREMKSSEGCGTMSVVSFLVDMVYISWSDSGVLSLRIFRVSMNVWYVYRFLNANMLCLLNKGFVCSFWKKSTLSHWYWYGLALAQVLNFSRYFILSPKSILTQDFCDVKILFVIQAEAPPHTEIQYVRWDSKRV